MENISNLIKFGYLNSIQNIETLTPIELVACLDWVHERTTVNPYALGGKYFDDRISNQYPKISATIYESAYSDCIIGYYHFEFAKMLEYFKKLSEEIQFNFGIQEITNAWLAYCKNFK